MFTTLGKYFLPWNYSSFSYSANKHLLRVAKEVLGKVNNKEIYVFSVNIQHVSHRFLVFLLLTLKRQLFARQNQ